MTKERLSEIYKIAKTTDYWDEKSKKYDYWIQLRKFINWNSERSTELQIYAYEKNTLNLHKTLIYNCVWNDVGEMEFKLKRG